MNYQAHTTHSNNPPAQHLPQHPQINDNIRRFILESVHSYIVGHGSVGVPSGISIRVGYENGHYEEFGSAFESVHPSTGNASNVSSTIDNSRWDSNTMNVDLNHPHNAVPGPAEPRSMPVQGETSTSRSGGDETDDIPTEVWDRMTEKERAVYIFGDSDDEGDNESTNTRRPTRPIPRRVRNPRQG